MHIQIPKPNDHGISYINRKGFPSILLQGICDHRLKFIHAYTGEVGSNHDATVLKRSEVWNYINENFNEKFPNDTHLLGDEAYPCLPQLITPYKDNGNLTVPQRNFNFLWSRTRSTIERAFCLLQKKFRILKDLLDVRRLDWIPKYVIACCVLHNICIMQNDLMKVEAIVAVQNDSDVNDDIFVGAMRPRLLQGQAKRNRLCQE
ncbi:hypothetical protein JTB14_035800 [Gonioctena quinquepunctata]|nr:hypothetical protein JTB14_035800 [Gonioctena quinquepunctata]